MDYKEKINNLYHIIKENFTSEIEYIKNKDFFIIECKNVSTKNREELKLKIKIDYNSFMTNEMNWSYCTSIDNDSYITRKDTLETLSETISNILEKEMFEKNYLETLPLKKINESNSAIDTIKLREIDTLNLTYWKVDAVNECINFNNHTFNVPELLNINTLKLLEFKNFLNNDQAYHEFNRIIEILKK